MSLYEETRLRLDDALVRLQACSAQHPQPDPTALHRAQDHVQKQLQELRRTALVSLAAKQKAQAGRKQTPKAGEDTAIVTAATATPPASKSSKSSELTDTAVGTGGRALPSIHKNDGSSRAAATDAASVNVSADTQRTLARDGEQYRRGDLLLARGAGASSGVAKKSVTSSPQSRKAGAYARTASKGKSSASMPLPSRVTADTKRDPNASSPPPRTTTVTPGTRALTPTLPSVARPGSSGAATSPAPAARTAFAEATTGAATTFAPALQLESSLVFVFTCLDKAAQALAAGLRQEAETLFLSSISADVENIRAIAGAIVPTGSSIASSSPAPAQAHVSAEAKKRAGARQSSAGSQSSLLAAGDVDPDAQSWETLFDADGNSVGGGGGGGGGSVGFLLAFDDDGARERSPRQQEAYHFGVHGKHATRDELPLALRAYYAVQHYDMLKLVLDFHRVVGSDPYGDTGAAVLLEGVRHVETLVQALCDMAVVPPLRGGRDELPARQPSQPPLTRVGEFTVKELLAVRENLTEAQRQQLVGVRANFADDKDSPPVRIDYKVGENGYYLVFTGTVYVYEMVQYLLQRAHSLQQQLDRSSRASEAGSGAGSAEGYDESSALRLEIAAITSAGLGSTAVNEHQWVSSVLSALTGTSADDAPDVLSKSAQTAAARNQTPSSIRAQLDRLFVACTTLLARCIDVCEGQSPLLFKLAATKYLGWRVKLYEALAQMYEWRGQYSEALAVVRRMTRKTKELVSLEFYDPVPPPAESQAILETALQRGGLVEMKYAWYVFIAGHQAFEVASDAHRRAVSAGSAADATNSAVLAEYHGGGATSDGADHPVRGPNQLSSSDARHRATGSAGPSGSMAADGAAGTSVVVSESGAVVTEASLPRTGAALLAEVWRCLYRHPLPHSGSKSALEEEAHKTASSSMPGSPMTNIPSSTKAKRKNSVGRRASQSQGPNSSPQTQPPSQASLAQAHRNDALAYQKAQHHRACLAQFAAQALEFLSGFLVKPNARVEAVEKDFARLIVSGSTARGKSVRVSSAGGPHGSSAASAALFANLRGCAREALEIVFHCLSAQAISLPEARMRGALLLGINSTHGDQQPQPWFPFATHKAFSIEEEDAHLMEEVGARLLAAAEQSKADALMSEMAGAQAAGADGAGTGKGHKKSKAKATAAPATSQAGHNNHSTGVSTSAATTSGGAIGGSTEASSTGAADAVMEDPVFITFLSVHNVFPHLSRLARWERLESAEALSAAATEYASRSTPGLASSPTLRLPLAKGHQAATRSPLGLHVENPLEKEIVLLLRLYLGLFPTACHAVYMRAGAVLGYLLRSCRGAAMKAQQQQQQQRPSHADHGLAPTTPHLLASVETAVRLLQHLHFSVLVSHVAAETCCPVDDVLLTRHANLRLVGLSSALATHSSVASSTESTHPNAIEAEAVQVVKGPTALLSGLVISVQKLIAAQEDHANTQKSLFRPITTSPSSATSPSSTASAQSRAYPLCTPQLAPAELLRQLASAVMGGATTASWPSRPLLGSAVDISYACAALFEQTLFVTADLILHEATTSIAYRRDARQNRERLGLMNTPFHDPTPSMVRAPVLEHERDRILSDASPSSLPSSSKLKTEEEVDEAQEKTYFQVVIRTVEALATTGAVDPALLGRLTHSLADTALQDLEAVQRTTGQPATSSPSWNGEDGKDDVTIKKEKSALMSLTRPSGKTVGRVDEIPLPTYPRERQLQDLLERARLAHAFVTIATQLVVRRAETLERVVSGAGVVRTKASLQVSASHAVRLRQALEDTHTDLTRTAAQLRWYVALLCAQAAAYTQRQEDIRTLLDRQLHSDIYGVASAKETRILATLLNEEPALPQSVEAEEASLISATYHDPLKSATVMLALATVVPKPLSAQRELLSRAFDVLLKLENAPKSQSRAASVDGERSTAGARAKSKKKGASEVSAGPSTAAATGLFSRLMIWGYAASTSARLGVMSLANTARSVLYRHYVYEPPSLVQSAQTTQGRVGPAKDTSRYESVEQQLRAYQLQPRFDALPNCSEGALNTLCHALLDLSQLELSALSDGPTATAAPHRTPTRTSENQQIGLRCAYRLLFALQLLAMRQADRTGSGTGTGGADAKSTSASASAANAENTATAGKSTPRNNKASGSTKSKAEHEPSSPAGSASVSLTSFGTTVDASRVTSVIVTDALTFRCAHALLNALLPVLEDDAFCAHVVAPLVALCHTVIGLRRGAVWCEVNTQLFAIRVVKAMRDTLDRLTAQRLPPRAQPEVRAAGSSSPSVGGSHGYDTDALTHLMHRTFVHAWNAVYSFPSVRQQRFFSAVAAESTHARQVLNTKDGVPLPPEHGTRAEDENARAQPQNAAGRARHGQNQAKADESAVNTSSAAATATGAPTAEDSQSTADDVFLFAGAQYAPAPSAAFIYDTMPVEYLDCLEYLLLSRCTPEAVEDLLHPRPVPPPPRLPPLPHPTPTSVSTAAKGESTLVRTASLEHPPARGSMQAGKKMATVAVRRVSSQLPHTTSGAPGSGRLRQGLSTGGSTSSQTAEEAAAVSEAYQVQQQEKRAVEREVMKTQLQERLRMQADYAIACCLGDDPLHGLPDVVVQLAEALAREYTSAALSSTRVASFTSSAHVNMNSGASSGTPVEVLEHYAHDPLQTRLAVSLVVFYLRHNDTHNARAVAKLALSKAAEQWRDMKAFRANMEVGLRQWQIQHGFVLSDRPHLASGGRGEDADDNDGAEGDGGEKVQPGARRSRSEAAKGKGKSGAASKRTNSNTAAGGKKKAASHPKGRHRGAGGNSSLADGEAGEAVEEGPDQRFLTVTRVWSSAEQLMLKQITRSVTWLRRRYAFKWLTRRFFQFNGPAQAQLRMYTAATMCMERNQLEASKGTGSSQASLVQQIAFIRSQSCKGDAATGGPLAVGRRSPSPALATRPASPSTAVTASSKGKRAQQQHPAESEVATAEQAREESEKLDLLIAEHSLRAAKLFNQAFLPAKSVRAVCHVVQHLRQALCAQLPDGFVLSAGDPFSEVTSGGAGAALSARRRRSDLFDDDQYSEYTSSRWNDGGSVVSGRGGGGDVTALAAIDVASFLPTAVVDTLRQLAPCLVALAKELLCAMATVALGYCDHRHDLEVTLPSAIKTGAYVCLQEQLHFQGIVPSLVVCVSPAGQFEEKRHALLTQQTHTRDTKQMQRRLRECEEMERTTRVLLIETYKSELVALVESRAEQETEAGREDSAAVWFEFVHTVRAYGAGWNELDLLSPESRARRAQPLHTSSRRPPRMFTVDGATATGAGAGGVMGTADSESGAVGASRRRAGQPTSTLVYFPFETPLLRRRLWTDATTTDAPAAVGTSSHGQTTNGGRGAASAAASEATAPTLHALRLGSDMPETLLVESLLYLVRAVHLTHQKEAVQLCLAANALTSGRYATSLLSLAMTIQAAIGVSSTSELLRAYQLARAETPVGVGLLEVARRGWQRYTFTDAFQRARQRLGRSLLPALKHFEDPAAGGALATTATIIATNTSPAPEMPSHGSFDYRMGGGDGALGAATLKVSLKTVVAQYEVALAALRRNRDFGLAGECLSEMAEVYLLHRSRTEAEACWRDAVDSLLETPRSLQTWRTAPCDASQLTFTRVLLAVSALSSLAMYAFREQQRKAVDACVLAASLVDRLLTEVGISLMLPERAFDYAGHRITGLHRALCYLDLPLRQYQQIHKVVHHMLYVSQTLLEFDYAIHASLVATFAEYLAHRFAKHWVMVVEARLLRARAAAKSGHFTAAFDTLRSVCLGEAFPDAVLALAPIGDVRDSIVLGQHFARAIRGGVGGGASTAVSAAGDTKKAQRPQSNVTHAGGAGSGGNHNNSGMSVGGGGAAGGALSTADGGGPTFNQATVPGPVDGHAHASVLEVFLTLQYRNDQVPSSAANADYVAWFVAACLPNFSSLAASAATTTTTPTSTGAAGPSSSSSGSDVPCINPALCLDAGLAEWLGPLIAPRVVLAVAEVLVSLGGREGAYQWGEGVIGDMATAIAWSSRPASARTSGRSTSPPSSRASPGSAGSGANSHSKAASTLANGTPTPPRHGAAIVVESGPAVVLRKPTACTVALQVAEPLLDWLRHNLICLSPLPLADAGTQSASQTSASGRGGTSGRSLSTANGLSSRAGGAAVVGSPSSAAGLGVESSDTQMQALVQQQRVSQAAMVRHHATHLRAVALLARGRVRQAGDLMEAHIAEYNGLTALGEPSAADSVDATGASTAAAEAAVGEAGVRGRSTNSASAARSPSLSRGQNTKLTRPNAATEATFSLLGKGFGVSAVVCTPSYFLTVGHTHWCRVYAVLTASYFGLRRFQAMEATIRHALSLCEQCEDPYSARMFQLYQCAAQAQRGQLEDAAETARQLHSMSSALSFAPHNLDAMVMKAASARENEGSGEGVGGGAVPSVANTGAASRGSEQLVAQLWRLAVPCAHTVAAADAWDVTTLLVLDWIEQALAQQANQQSTLRTDADEAMDSRGKGKAGGRRGLRSRTNKKKTQHGRGSDEEDDEKDSEGLAAAHTGGSGLIASSRSRAVCALAAGAFFAGVVPWFARDADATHGRDDPATSPSDGSARRSPLTRKAPPHTPGSMRLPHWVISPHASRLAWNNATLTQLHGAMNAFAAALVTPAATRSEIHQAMGALSQALEGVAPQYDTRAHPTQLIATKLILARAALHVVDWNEVVYPSATSVTTSAGIAGTSPATPPRQGKKGHTGSTSSRPPSSHAHPGAVGSELDGAHHRMPLLFRSPAEAVQALPHAGEDCVRATRLPARGLLQGAAALLFDVVVESVNAAAHDYGVLQVALLELAGIFARVSTMAKRAAASAPSSSATVSLQAQRRQRMALSQACAPIAASCTILAMLLHEMQTNVFDRTRAFVDYATDEARMVMPLPVLQRVLPERVVATVEAATRQLGTLHNHIETSAALSPSVTEVDKFHRSTAADLPSSGRVRSGNNNNSSSSTAAADVSTLTPGNGVPLTSLIHAFATLHREQGMSALLPASEALDREAALLVLRSLLQTKTAPPSCVYLCYSEDTRRAQVLALCGGASGAGTVGIGFANTSSNAGATRRAGGGGVASAANAAAQQQQQEMQESWYAMLPPVLLSGAVDGYLTSAGAQLLGAPSINTVVAACFQAASGADLLYTRTSSEPLSSKPCMTLLLAVSPYHDDQLTQAPSLATPADRKRLLRPYPTCVQLADNPQSYVGAERGTGRSGRAGSVHSADGFTVRRRGSSRQGLQSGGAARLGQPRGSIGLGVSGGGGNSATSAAPAAVANVGDGRTRALAMDALLAERIDTLTAAGEEAARVAVERTSDASIATTPEYDSAHGEDGAWACLCIALPLDDVRQLHACARHVLQLQARLVECQRRAVNVTGATTGPVTVAGSDSSRISVGAPPAGPTASNSPSALTRKGSVLRIGGASSMGVSGHGTVMVPTEPGPLASGVTQLQAALSGAMATLKAKASAQGALGAGVGGAGSGASSSGNNAGGLEGAGASAAGGAGSVAGSAANTARHAGRRTQSSLAGGGGEGASVPSARASATGGSSQNDALVDARVHDLAQAESKQREAMLHAELSAVSDELDEAKSAFVMGLVETLVRTYVARALADEAVMDACVAQLLPECAMTPALFTFFEQWFSAAASRSASSYAAMSGQQGAEASVSTAAGFFQPGLHEWMRRVTTRIAQWRDEALE